MSTFAYQIRPHKGGRVAVTVSDEATGTVLLLVYGRPANVRARLFEHVRKLRNASTKPPKLRLFPGGRELAAGRGRRRRTLKPSGGAS